MVTKFVGWGGGPALSKVAPMTSIDIEKEPPVPEREAPPGAGSGPSATRLVGVDLARALAVFGMFAVHVGPGASDTDGSGGWLRGLAEGRASALFATLAGFSLVLITGRREPKTGLAGRQARTRVVVRAVVLLVLGTVLSTTSFGPAVILNYYGVYFLLALPLVRLRARKLAITAAATAVIGPQVAFVLRALLHPSVGPAINAYDPLERICGVGILDLFVTGFYPAITWMPFVIAGMAVGRLDLLARTVQWRLAAFGAGLAAFAYGTSWLLLRLVGPPGFTPMPSSGSLADAGASSTDGIGSGPFAVDGWLALAAVPHSGSTFDVLGCLGVALLVIAGVTAALARFPKIRWWVRPVIAVGTMSLTVYVGHILAIVALPGGDATPPTQASAGLLAGFVVGAVVFASVWSRFFRRGPLEYLLNHATRVAGLVR